MAETLGGRDAFIDACYQSDSKDARIFLALWKSLPTTERDASTLQDLCTRASLSPTQLVGSMMGSLIMQSNNVALLESALNRPQVMRDNLVIARRHDKLGLAAQEMQFRMGGLLKGEGTQVFHVTQNVQGEGMMSFEDAAHQSAASVKAEGRPAVAEPPVAMDNEASCEIIEAEITDVPS